MDINGYTVQESMELLNLSMSEIRRLIKQRRLTVMRRIGQIILIDPTSLQTEQTRRQMLAARGIRKHGHSRA